MCYNAVDAHVHAGHGDKVAIIYDSPVTQTIRKYTYSELLAEVARFSGTLKQHGVTKGDRVLFYMPMVPEALIAMLACARLGAIHCVTFGGFAATELAKRIQHAEPKVILAATCGIEKSRILPYKPALEHAIEISTHKPSSTIILQRPQHREQLKRHANQFDWEAETRSAKPQECVSLDSNDPLYLIYTSGTTGDPKGLVRATGDYAVVLHWSMKNVYNIDRGDVFFAASDIGWVLGHSYSVYGPLLRGATTVFYEGKPIGTPDCGAFWRVIEQHKVKSFFVSPTGIRAIRSDPKADELLSRHDLRSLESLWLAGERLDTPTLEWLKSHVSKNGTVVVDNWWQTETGWPMSASCIGMKKGDPVRDGTCGSSIPGWQLAILDETGKPVPSGTMGHIVAKLPLPPGASRQLWKRENGFHDKYLSSFPGYYDTGDLGTMDADGYLTVSTRADDVINVAAHRLSTKGIEEVLSQHPSIVENCVIGRKDQLKGEIPFGFAVLKPNNSESPSKIELDLVKDVRDKIGAFACYTNTLFVPRLPKTKSGKLLRHIVQKMINEEPFNLPTTIEDPEVLNEIHEIIKSFLSGRKKQ